MGKLCSIGNNRSIDIIIILDTLDLSGKKLKKLNKPTHSEAQVTTLILDDNELQRLDNIDSFIKVQKVRKVAF